MLTLNLACVHLLLAAVLPDQARPGGRAELPPARRAELAELSEAWKVAAFEAYRRGEVSRAAESVRVSTAIRRLLYPPRDYPDGHLELVLNCVVAGALLHSAAEYSRAEGYLTAALNMSRRLFPATTHPQGHQLLHYSLTLLGVVKQSQGEYAKAEAYCREAVAVNRRMYPPAEFPDGHEDLAASVNTLGFVLRASGEFAESEQCLTQALEINRRLYPAQKYPDGHHHLAVSLDNVAAAFQRRGAFAEAKRYRSEAAAMLARLYPPEKFPGRVEELATSLSNLGGLHLDAGEPERAIELFEQAGGLRKKLYPRSNFPSGHPDLARDLMNLSSVHARAGRPDRAEALCRQAVAAFRESFPRATHPHGHPSLAESLTRLGQLLLGTSRAGEAGDNFREALGILQPHWLRYAELASEAEALNFAASLPRARDGYLSVTARQGGGYDLVWPSRSALTRLLERRHRDAVGSRDSDVSRLVGELRDVRLRLQNQHYASGGTRRDTEAELGVRKEALERLVAEKLPAAPLPGGAPEPTPARLSELLGRRSAFVELIRYTHTEADQNSPGRVRTEPRYAAFVLSGGRPVVRVELGSAAQVEHASAAWLAAVLDRGGAVAAERASAAAVGRLVWEPIRGHLPADLASVYLTPDGPLTRLPWAALPGRNPGTVLLDDHAVAVVPHGQLLLDRLGDGGPVAAKGHATLVVGGVDYAGAGAVVPRPAEAAPAPVGKAVRWEPLPATGREGEAVTAQAVAAGLGVTHLSGAVASAERLLAELPKAQYAHLATHGFFAPPEFRSALRLDPNVFESPDGKPHLGGRSPLVLSGLVLAAANRPDQADRGILTAEAVVGLPLGGMDLATVSACETGLGEVADGEGVFGLVRAFHVAGCKTVVASLWKVDDDATAALMAEFYRNLWGKKLPAPEALRQAQLTVYRHPERIPELARPRGAPRPGEAVAVGGGGPGRTADTRLWAAFVVSGVGK